MEELVEKIALKERLTGLYKQWKLEKSKDWRMGRTFDEWLKTRDLIE